MTSEAQMDERTRAVLLTKAMVFAADADGKLSEGETMQLTALLRSVHNLRSYPPEELMREARATTRGIGELPTLELRRTAFVLAAEVIALDGDLSPEEDDANLEAVGSLATRLDVGDEFVGHVVTTLAIKYHDSSADDDAARTLLQAVMLPAVADGRIDEDERLVIRTLTATIPEFRHRDLTELAAQAKERLRAGLRAASEDFLALPKLRNKCYALACESAHAARGSEALAGLIMLDKLKDSIGPSAKFVVAVDATMTAKYGD